MNFKDERDKRENLSLWQSLNTPAGPPIYANVKFQNCCCISFSVSYGLTGPANIYNSSRVVERRESKWSCFIANTLQGKVYQLFVHAEWKQITFSFKTFFNNKLEIHFHICIFAHCFYSGHWPEFSPQESSLFQGIFCKKRERKSFEKMQGVPLFFSKDEQNREWNPCEILFQLKWSCHRVFCSQREMLLLLLTLISWTNFLSLGIKIWGHAKKLLFPIFHWAVVLQAWPINLLYMLGPSAKKTRRKFTSFLPKQLFSVYNAMDKQTCQSKPNNFNALGAGISHWPVLTQFWFFGRLSITLKPFQNQF